MRIRCRLGLYLSARFAGRALRMIPEMIITNIFTASNQVAKESFTALISEASRFTWLSFCRHIVVQNVALIWARRWAKLLDRGLASSILSLVGPESAYKELSNFVMRIGHNPSFDCELAIDPQPNYTCANEAYKNQLKIISTMGLFVILHAD